MSVAFRHLCDKKDKRVDGENTVGISINNTNTRWSKVKEKNNTIIIRLGFNDFVLIKIARLSSFSLPLSLCYK